MKKESRPRKSIRSFAVRGGRLTRGQRRAVEELLPEYELRRSDCGESKVDYRAVFCRQAETIVEIGFGDGESLCEMARKHPENNYIGLEVYQSGVGQLLLQIKKFGLSNIRIFVGDASVLIDEAFHDNSLSRINLFFPDPWPKKKHHKRRILQPDFIDCVAAKLGSGGIFHFTTDWEDYAAEAMEKLKNCSALRNMDGTGIHRTLAAQRPKTKFERRGERLGHNVWDIVMKKSDGFVRIKTESPE